MRLTVICLLVVTLIGCGQPLPTVAGGKPVSYWVQGLRNPDPKLRKQAAFKLGNVGSTDETVLPALLAGLKDADACVRCEVILALLKCGEDAKLSVPLLTELHKQDHDPKVRSYAAKALEKLQ